MKNEQTTEPATEQNLSLEYDAHPFDAEPVAPSNPHPVLVDGICGVAAIGSHGTYSTRLKIWLSEEHPELGRTFSTKYFRIEQPGRVEWGHQGQSFTIEKILEEITS